jgi:hypothetical protein
MENAMRQLVQSFAICGIFLLIGASSAMSAPLNTMDEVGAAIRACWVAPTDSKDSFVTLVFSFKRDGTLIAPPRPSGISVDGDADAKKKFVDAAIAAVEQCAPLEFAPALAQGIGGRVFTMQFSADAGASIAPQ